MMTTRFLRQVAVFGLMVLLTVTSIQAQEGGGRQRGGRGGFGGFGGGGGPGGQFGGPRLDRAALLRIDKVRQELKIEEAQAATIDAALDAYNEQRSASPRPDREAFEKMTEEERTAYFEKSQKEREELSKKTDEILGALLEVPQVKRLEEVTIQARLATSATTTLKADDIKGKLMISDEQIAKLDEAQKVLDEERQKAFQDAFAGGGGQGGDRDAMRAKMTEMMAAMQKKSTEAAMAVLTDDQKKSLEEMKGAAFELTMRDFMGGRGFGGPPGGGGRGEGGGRGGNGGGRPPAE